MKSQINFSVTAEVKAAVIALGQQATAQLAIPANIPDPGKKQTMGQGSKGYVQDCVATANSYPDVPSGTVDTKVMQTKLNNCDDLDELINIFRPLTLSLMRIRRLDSQDLMFTSNGIKENFEREATYRVELKPVSDNLNKRYIRAKKEDMEAKGDDKDSEIQNG